MAGAAFGFALFFLVIGLGLMPHRGGKRALLGSAIFLCIGVIGAMQ